VSSFVERDGEWGRPGVMAVIVSDVVMAGSGSDGTLIQCSVFTIIAN
jgi:hypothetical protein